MTLYFVANLFCDGEINCGFNDEDFGADERNCDGSNRQGKSEDGEKSFSDRPASLYVFAITCVATLVVVIILVLIACCCIRRFATRAHQQQQHNHHGGSSHLHHLELHLDTSMYVNNKLYRNVDKFKKPGLAIGISKS